MARRSQYLCSACGIPAWRLQTLSSDLSNRPRQDVGCAASCAGKPAGPVRTAKPKRALRRAAFLAAGLALLLLAAACTNDIIPRGGWSGPVFDGGYLYIGGAGSGGHIRRIDANTGQLDAAWIYPSGKTTLGAIYGSPLISDGIVYGDRKSVV